MLNTKRLRRLFSGRIYQHVLFVQDLCRAHEAKEASRKRREHVFVVPQVPCSNFLTAPNKQTYRVFFNCPPWSEPKWKRLTRQPEALLDEIFHGRAPKVGSYALFHFGSVQGVFWVCVGRGESHSIHHWHKRHHREMIFFLHWHLQAPSPQPKKGRRKSGLKPKKREGKGDEFLLQNGKQVQQENWTCYDCVNKVNLKTPDVTVETEEQYKTKVGKLIS